MATGVVAALTYVGTSLATAEAVAATTVAIATSVAYGAAVGAVIGAGTALATGGDIGEGALTGAAIGGVTAGVGEGVGQYAASAATPATTPSASAAVSAPASASLEPASTGLLETTTAVPGYTEAAGNLANTSQVASSSNVGLLSSPTTTSADLASEAAKQAVADSAKSRIWAGVGEGAATAAGTVYAQKMKDDAAREVIKKQDEKMNAAKGTTPTTSTFKRPDRWNRRYVTE